MTLDPVRLLSFNAGLQVLFASLVGVYMLLPLQPWGAKLRGRIDARSILSAHLDWLMLAFMQWGAAFTMWRFTEARSLLAAWLLVFGGWLNPTPYLFRGLGIDAFVFAGPPRQRLAAALAGASVAAIIAAWVITLVRLARG